MKKRKTGFTLIELIAVLVIMAILALIVTPLVMSIIKKARVSADKRSIDAYGRSIELAIAGYLLDNGTFPTSIEQLTIEYSGEEVVCSTTQLNDDSSVYLTGCTVAGRKVDYEYGEDKKSQSSIAYEIGDIVTYNNIQYRVIADSSASEETVTLLKAEPLSYSDVETYSAATGADIANENGYGALEYGRSSEYETSYIKTTVNAWKTAEAPNATEARLITIEELASFGYEDMDDCLEDGYCVEIENVPSWIYGYNYWTMNSWSGDESWAVNENGTLSGDTYVSPNGDSGVMYLSITLVRPVITISKSYVSIVE